MKNLQTEKRNYHNALLIYIHLICNIILNHKFMIYFLVYTISMYGAKPILTMMIELCNTILRYGISECEVP